MVYCPKSFGLTEFPPLLQSTCQVPREWGERPKWITAILFGLGLGSGLYTRIIVPTFYLLLLWPLLSQPSVWAILFWALYGLVRTLNVWWLAITASPENPFEQAHLMVVSILDKSRIMYSVHAMLLLGLAIWLFTGLQVN